MALELHTDGQQHVGKELIEEIDEANKLVRFKMIPKEELSGVKWIVEFEKMHDDGHYPTKLIDFLIRGTKDIEAHHQQAST
ncbi:Kirola [Bienertia sinuspersici]